MSRKAFGPQRPMSNLIKATNVARSIREHDYDTRNAATWARYGLEGAQQETQRMLVMQAILDQEAAATGYAYERWTQR